MRRADSLFIVIEGLDGSGKTTAARAFATRLQAYLGGKVRLSSEPNDACCGGVYIRQVLEKKISRFSYETLAYAFAANRKDHGDRLIIPWLEKGEQQVFISDRYYLSSLVYQSNDKFSMAEIMELNRYAIQPDITFFLSVSPETCLQRMGTRNKPQELFEENFLQTQEKYQRGIAFLRKRRKEQIIEIDASGSLQEVVEKLATHLSQVGETWTGFLPFVKKQETAPLNQQFIYDVFQLPLTVKQVREQFGYAVSKSAVNSLFNELSGHEKGSILLDLLLCNGYLVEDQLPVPGVTGFELNYMLPGGVEQKGGVLFLEKSVGQAPLMSVMEMIGHRVDFIFAVVPDASDQEEVFFERDVYTYGGSTGGLFPKVKFFGEKEIANWLLEIISF